MLSGAAFLALGSSKAFSLLFSRFQKGRQAVRHSDSGLVRPSGALCFAVGGCFCALGSSKALASSKAAAAAAAAVGAGIYIPSSSFLSVSEGTLNSF